MKYEFDNRTGQLVQKKDDNIYFAKSQGCGLLIDDKKNNTRYILERNGNVTVLFGSMYNLNIYDRRDASIIVERVKRALGVSSRFNNIKCFLRGFNDGTLKSNVVECDCGGTCIGVGDCGDVPSTTGNGDGMGPIVFPTNGDNGFSGIHNGSGDIPNGLCKPTKKKKKKKLITYTQQPSYIKTYEEFCSNKCDEFIMEEVKQIKASVFMDSKNPKNEKFVSNLTPFEYNGITFYPVATDHRRTKYFDKIDNQIVYGGKYKKMSDNINYDYDSFYNKAKEYGYGNCDVFAFYDNNENIIDYCIPTSNVLAGFPMFPTKDTTVGSNEYLEYGWIIDKLKSILQ